MGPYETALVTDGFFSRSPKKFEDDDIIIAFIGQTGSGKSQIVEALTGESGRAAESFASVTQDLEAIRILNHRIYGSRIVLVDTPGFDDSSRTDEQILEMIGDWLKKTYKKGILLSGIVYVQRIIDPRMGSTPHRNLLTFGELTGSRSAKNVILVTTMWDVLGPMSGVGDRREQRLKDEYWNVMIHHGATVARFLNDSDSAWDIIDNFISREHNQKTQLIFQEERVEQKKRLKKTRAGEALSLDLRELIGRHEGRIQPSTTKVTTMRELEPKGQGFLGWLFRKLG